MSIRVLLVGPAEPGPHSRGGMATVMGHMAAHPGAEITVVPTYLDVGTVERLRVGVLGMLRAAALILAGRVDVLHVHLSHGGSVLRKAVPLWAARLRGVPAVVHGHSFDFGGWLAGLPGPARAVVRAALPADRWLVLSTGLAEEYRAALRLPADRVEVLHNPVPRSAVHAPDPRRDDVLQVVSLGRLGTRKGSYDLIEAVARLPAEVTDRLHVTLAGDGELDEVRAAAAAVSSTVTVRGWIDAAERDRVLAASHVFALPSHSEGLPMALLEAMAAGLAPLTSPVGGIPDVIVDGENGVLVPPGDTAALAAVLTGLVHDRENTARLAAAARERADDFDLGAWYLRLQEQWSGLAGRRRPPAGDGIRHVRVLGVEFADQSVGSAVQRLQHAIRRRDRARSVCFPNAATLNLAAADPDYRAVLDASDFVFADGTGIRWAARMRGVEGLANLNGTDVIPALLSATPGVRTYLLGGTDEVNAAAAEAVGREFPGVAVVGRHHGYFDLDDSADIVAEVKRAAPDLLLVGFGNPLQENWIAQNRAELRVPLIAGVGGLFGFWAGTRTRAAGITRRIGMEWVDIVIREPGKARRYLLGNPLFLYRALRARRGDVLAVSTSSSRAAETVAE